MATRWARFVRGWLTASVAVLVAALSHVAAGGESPQLISITLALAFAGMACVALAGTKLSLTKLTLSVGFSQVLFHVLFGLGGTSSASMTTTGHHGAVVVGATDAAAAVSAHGMLDMGWMWVAHAFAAVVTIVALRRGEQSFWSLLDVARLALVALVRTLGIIVSLPRQRAHVLAALARALVPTEPAVLLSPMRYRGPPVALSAL
ncbi:hypothetical protein [Cryobacterium roopkundense]|uniref:Uncharacterized protein n=1 Tax=Cryobacterium roopkundense TaxID=1001240 RepID=A0A7W9E5V0_9MICO|nr:hypothetical protein [Cryobacterium roopkundense]MBB5643611.1 hypothetical protein [Cryobacterium roopkundense]